ncbi:hypothetical protein B0H14DRAFT_284623 [Mycena olivaceomarginata]|nr:hypothetical protein B0H14DRAFT_284623 [Mycena olivaceomarginata]
MSLQSIMYQKRVDAVGVMLIQSRMYVCMSLIGVCGTFVCGLGLLYVRWVVQKIMRMDGWITPDEMIKKQQTQESRRGGAYIGRRWRPGGAAEVIAVIRSGRGGMYRRGGALSTGDERRRRVERGHRIRCGYWHRVWIVPLAAAHARAADATPRGAPLDRDGYHGRGDTAHVHLLLLLLLHLQHLHLVHVRRRGIWHGYRRMGMGMGVHVRVVIRRWGGERRRRRRQEEGAASPAKVQVQGQCA